MKTTMAKRHTAAFYDVNCQRHGAPLAGDDVGDEDQHIEHSDDERQEFDNLVYLFPSV